MPSTWTVLADKAAAALRDAQTRVNDARQQVEKLEAGVAHIDRLRADYVARYNETQKAAQSQAQRELAKMEAMVERDEREKRAQAAKREQRALDEAGLLLFNLR